MPPDGALELEADPIPTCGADAGIRIELIATSGPDAGFRALDVSGHQMRTRTRARQAAAEQHPFWPHFNEAV
jgi:hypothetical protein